MERQVRIFSTRQPTTRFTRGDLYSLAALAVLIYLGARLALAAPSLIKGPAIILSPRSLPLYAVMSLGRMLAAYALSLLFTLVYGYSAARSHRAEQVLLPILDVLQSVPILSFLPLVLLGFAAIMPRNVAAELAAIVLIFISQVWNLTFAWYQSLTTIPKELREASTVFRLNGWLRFKTLQLPFAAITLIWNSMMSWAGGWFFLMAAETFAVGQRDFRLPGLGAYLQAAANQGNLKAIAWGLGALILVIVVLDQFVWRPLLAWSHRFKLEMMEDEDAPTSWFYDFLRNSGMVAWFGGAVVRRLGESLDMKLIKLFPARCSYPGDKDRSIIIDVLVVLLSVGLLVGMSLMARMLLGVPLAQWKHVGLGLVATLLRVSVALAIALIWTVPIGVAIGTNPHLASWLQPLVQIIASIPATALFPIFLLMLVSLPGGLNITAVLLILMGTQWYLLFNAIAGASSIPRELKYTASLLRLSKRERWQNLVLPTLFPYLVTGAITASGGAWNASIVAEYENFGGKVLSTPGIGAIIAESTASGDYNLLLAATLCMILTVIAINRLVWRPLYRIAENRYRLE